MPLSRKFECTNCAVCCRSFKVVGRGISKDEEGVFYAADQRSRVLSLWRWEADRLRKWAAKKGIHLVIRPLSFLVDTYNSKAIIIVWYLDTAKCPFLEEDRCTIWEDRPFACKQFPLYGEKSGLGLSSICPDLVRPPLTRDEVENGALLKSTYPNEVLYLFKDMEIFKMVFGFVRDLEDNDVVRWDKGADLEDARDLFNDPGSRIDLFDLVVDKGVLERKNVDLVFSRLDTIDDIKDKVELRISRDQADI